MSHAKELTLLYRQFYRAKGFKTSSILYPLRIATETLLKTDKRLFNDPEALTEVVFGEVRRRVTKLQEDNLAHRPKGSTREEREAAMEQFADYLVNTIYYDVFKEDVSAMQGKQLNLLGSTCEALYRKENALEWAEQNQANEKKES